MSTSHTGSYKFGRFANMKTCLIFSLFLHVGLTTYIPSRPPGINFDHKPLQITVHSACSHLANRELADACLGCFWRLSSELQDSEFHGVLSDCTSTYLQSTIYSKCGSDLQESLVTGDGKNATAFCGFGKCVRENHSKQLINSCIEKSQKDSSDPVEIYTKTTSCILCKTYCIDKKFKAQFAYGPRTPAITLDSNNQVNLRVIPYYTGNDDELCTSRVPGPEMVAPIEGCDCSLPENEI